MSMEVGRIVARVMGDTADFDRKMAAAERSFTTTGSRLETAALRAAGKITAAFGGIKLGQFVLQSATSMDRLGRGLLAVSGSSEETGRQLVALRDIARLPGLGFAEAIQGSIRLQAVGISAATAERALRAFGNAIATTGGGRAELDRVTVQLGQLSSKGKVLAQDLRPIIEAAPMVGRALREAFGTVNADDIEKLGLTTDQFLDRLLSQLERLPKVSGGAANTFENLSDSARNSGAAVGRIFLPAVVSAAEGTERMLGSIERLAGTGDVEAWSKRATAGIGALADAGKALVLVYGVRTAAGFAKTRREALATAATAREVAAGTTFAAKAEAAAALEVARARAAETAATIRSMEATRASIAVARADALAKLQQARAIEAQAARVPIASLAPLGGAAVAREMERRTAATRQASAATRELAILGQQEARVRTQLAAATKAHGAAQVQAAASSTTLTRAAHANTAALQANTVAGRAWAASSRAAGSAVAFLGGPIGAGITAFGLMLLATRRLRKEFDETTGSIGELSDAIRNLSRAELLPKFQTEAARMLRMQEDVAAAQQELAAAREKAGERSTFDTSVAAAEAALSTAEVALRRQTELVQQLGLAYTEAGKAIDDMPPLPPGGGQIAAPGLAGLPDTLASWDAIFDALRDTREQLRDLEFQKAFETQKDRAEKLNESIAETRRQLQLLEAAASRIGRMREFLNVQPGAVAPISGAGLVRQQAPLSRGTGFSQSEIRQLGGGRGAIRPTIDVTQFAHRRQQAAAAEASVALETLGNVASATGTRLGDVASGAASFIQSMRANVGGPALAGMGVALGMQVIGALGDLFAESPEERERKRVLRDNTAALDRVRSGLARLGSSLRSERGMDVSRVMRAAQEAVQRPQTQIGTPETQFARALNRMGLTVDDANRIAQSFGITLDGSRKAFNDLIEVIGQVKIGDLFRDFGSQLDRLGMRFELFDIEDPREQLASLRDLFMANVGGPDTDMWTAAMGGSASALGDIGRRLMDADLSTEEGLSQFRQGLRDLFDALPEMDLAALGEMSLSEWQDMLLRMNGLAKSASDASKEIDKMAGGMRNVPNVFKVALARFNADLGRVIQPTITTPPRTPPPVAPIGGGGDSAGGTVYQIDNITLNANGVNDPIALLDMVEEEANRRARRGGQPFARAVRRN